MSLLSEFISNKTSIHHYPNQKLSKILKIKYLIIIFLENVFIMV